MKRVWRAIVEAGFIVFLFYSNLLMGEFERAGVGQSKGFVWAIHNVVDRAPPLWTRMSPVAPIPLP